MYIKASAPSAIPEGIKLMKVDPGKARGIEPLKMRAKGTGCPPEGKLLRPDASTGTVVRNIKRKARIARTTSEDVARALCAIRSGEVKVL